MKKAYLVLACIGLVLSLVGCAQVDGTGNKSNNITLSTTSVALVVGGTPYQLTVTPSTAVVTWTSSAPSVVSVSSSGLVTALTAGTATITAASATNSAVCAVMSNVIFETGNVQTSASDYGLTLPAYWKNGALSLLPVGSATTGNVSGLTVNGTDIYIGGNLQNGGVNTPVYWKNGNLVFLPVPSGMTAQVSSGLQVDASGNLYVRGSGNLTTNGYQVAGYWLNGTWVTLPTQLPNGDTSGGGNASWGHFITASGDVYWCGYVVDVSKNYSQIPVYWKNGTLYLLPSTQAAIAIMAVGQTGSGLSSSVPAAGSIAYAGTGTYAGISATGTVTAGTPNSISMTITYSNFIDSSGYTINGSVTESGTFTGPFSSLTSENLTFSGSQTLSSTTLPITSLSENMTVTRTSGSTSPTISGTVTANGKQYQASQLMLGTSNGSFIASVEPSPFLQQFTLVVASNDSNWTPANPSYSFDGGATFTAIPTGSSTNGVVWWVSPSPSGDLYGTGAVGPSVNFWEYLAAPVYWKNWSVVTLPTTTAQPYGYTGGATFMGNDVYIDGQINDTSGGAATPVYWSNGTLNQLPVPSPYVGARESSCTFVHF